ARRGGAAHRPRRPLRGGPAQAGPARPARAEIPPWLRGALPGPCPSGGRRLRLRLPPRPTRRAGPDRAARPAERLGRRLVAVLPFDRQAALGVEEVEPVRVHEQPDRLALVRACLSAEAPDEDRASESRLRPLLSLALCLFHLRPPHGRDT